MHGPYYLMKTKSKEPHKIWVAILSIYLAEICHVTEHNQKGLINLTAIPHILNWNLSSSLGNSAVDIWTDINFNLFQSVPVRNIHAFNI